MGQRKAFWTSHHSVKQLETQAGAATAATAAPIPGLDTITILATMTTPALVAKVKLGQVINQGLDEDIPLLSETVLTQMRDRYIRCCEDESLSAVEASDAQLTVWSAW